MMTDLDLENSRYETCDIYPKNKNDSCNFHNLGIRSENSRYYCCGSLHTTENTFCRIGYHIGNAEE